MLTLLTIMPVPTQHLLIGRRETGVAAPTEGVETHRFQKASVGRLLDLVRLAWHAKA